MLENINHPQQRLAAILVAGIVGYSALIHNDEYAKLVMLDRMESDTMTPVTTGQSGQIVKGTLTSVENALSSIGKSTRQAYEAVAEGFAIDMRQIILKPFQ